MEKGIKYCVFMLLYLMPLYFILFKLLTNGSLTRGRNGAANWSKWVWPADLL